MKRIRMLNELTKQLERQGEVLAMLALHSTHPSQSREAARIYLELVEAKNTLQYREGE